MARKKQTLPSVKPVIEPVPPSAPVAPGLLSGRAAKERRRQLLAELEQLRTGQKVTDAREVLGKARRKLAAIDMTPLDRARQEVERAEIQLFTAEHDQAEAIKRIEVELLAVTPR